MSEPDGDLVNKKDRHSSAAYDGPVDEKFADYVQNLMNERDSLDPERYPIAFRLIQNELENIAKGTQATAQENSFIDLYNDAPITLHVKAIPPSKAFPKFNYAGRIIGPKGTYLKGLMKETMTKMILLGRGVMKDKDKEEELRNGTDPKFYHLNEDMHVNIQVTAPAAEAYARVAYAITCLKQQVLSDNRALENLPWISNTNRVGDGVCSSSTKYSRQPQPSSSRSHSQSHVAYSGGYNHQSRPTSYDYPPEEALFHRRYPRQSPPPSKYEVVEASQKYGDHYRRSSHESGGGRAMDFIDKARGSSRPYSSHSRGSSPPPARSHSYAYDYDDPYYDGPVASSHHYYEGEGRGSWSSGSHGSYKSPSQGVSKYSHPPRYAPYKK